MPSLFNKFKAICLAAIFCTGLAAQEKRSVAIPDPIGRGANITQMNRDVVRSTLTMWIVNSSDYNAVDRNFVDETLIEQNFQRDTGLVDQSRVAEIGKMLNADLVCVIYMTKDGGMINVEAQAIDVTTGKLFNAASELVDDDNRAIRAGTEELAKKLLRLEGVPPRPQNEPSLSVVLKTVNGDKNITPVPGERFRVGSYDFKGNFPQTWTSDKMPPLHVMTDRTLVENETIFLLRVETKISNRAQVTMRVADITKKPSGDMMHVPITVKQLQSRLYEIKPQLPQATGLYILYITPKDDNQPLIIFDFAIMQSNQIDT